MKTNADLFAQFADHAGAIDFREFNATVAAHYRYDVDLDEGITQDDFLALITGKRPEDALNRILVNEEITAFAAYLRAVCRTRALFRKLVAQLDEIE